MDMPFNFARVEFSGGGDSTGFQEATRRTNKFEADYFLKRYENVLMLAYTLSC